MNAKEAIELGLEPETVCLICIMLDEEACGPDAYQRPDCPLAQVRRMNLGPSWTIPRIVQDGYA